MSILLYRIDERLIHGQVTVGWGARLRPERLVVVDREVAESDWEQELYLLGVPEGVNAEFVAPEAARTRLAEWKGSPSRIILLTRDVATMVEVGREGGLAGEAVNLGGIHFQAGREEVLPYIFLDQDLKDQLKVLEASGAEVSAQDLPDSSEVPLRDLVD
jgi:mannose/fructose/N-acetylgalactosamine-specific phosphotransferase system component IIB